MRLGAVGCSPTMSAAGASVFKHADCRLTPEDDAGAFAHSHGQTIHGAPRWVVATVMRRPVFENSSLVRAPLELRRGEREAPRRSPWRVAANWETARPVFITCAPRPIVGVLLPAAKMSVLRIRVGEMRSWPRNAQVVRQFTKLFPRVPFRRRLLVLDFRGERDGCPTSARSIPRRRCSTRSATAATDPFSQVAPKIIGRACAGTEKTRPASLRSSEKTRDPGEHGREKKNIRFCRATSCGANPHSMDHDRCMTPILRRDRIAIVYMLFGGGLFGRLVHIFIVAKMLSRWGGGGDSTDEAMGWAPTPI